MSRAVSACVALLAVQAWAVAAEKPDEPIAGSFDANGVKICYYVQGKGEPVVLIHGLYASARMNWQMPGIMAALARDHQVIALDLPGHGASDKPDQAEAYGERLADDVVLLMDHLKIPKAHVVGYSMGGMIVSKLLAKDPNRVISAALGGMGWMRKGGMLARTWEGMDSQKGSVPAACLREMGKLGITEAQLKAIQTPTIILVGDRDPVRRLYVDPLLAVRNDWPVVEIADAGHLNCILKKQFLDAVVDWVAKNTTDKAAKDKSGP